MEFEEGGVMLVLVQKNHRIIQVVKYLRLQTLS